MILKLNVVKGRTLQQPSKPNQCTFCRQDHISASCPRVKDVETRKDILRKTGRCFVCMRRNHISRNCRSVLKCSLCQGRHHVAICPTKAASVRPPTTETTAETTNLYTNTRNAVLLQTGTTTAHNPNDPSVTTRIRALLDSGSMRTYITAIATQKLQLTVKGRENAH